MIKFQIIHSYQNSTDHSNIVISKQLSPKNIFITVFVQQDSSSEGPANEEISEIKNAATQVLEGDNNTITIRNEGASFKRLNSQSSNEGRSTHLIRIDTKKEYLADYPLT